MKKIKIIVISLLLISCKKIIDKDPISNITPDNFYKTAENAKAALVSAYAPLEYTGAYRLWMMIYGELPSDNTDAGEANDADPNLIDNFALSPSGQSKSMLEVWSAMYIGISRCNTVLDRVPTISMNMGEKEIILAEARFLRALYYFNLVRIFGGVPLMTNEVKTPEEALKPRSTPEEIYKFMIEDLERAITVLPVNQALGGKATKGAARALLAKVYLTRAGGMGVQSEVSDYSAALQNAEAVITSGQYTLLPKYADVFSADNKFNKEIIFAAQFVSTNSGTNNNSASYSDIAQYSGPRYVGTGYWLNFPADGPDGYGWNTVSTSMLQAYIAPGNLEDPRRSFSVLTNPVNKVGSYIYKYRSVKRQTRAIEGQDNMPILRYSDVLLMAAEASNEISGPNEQALNYLNQVRVRADEGTGKVPPYNITGDPTDPFVLSTKEEFREAVIHERRIELAFEAQRWFDLIRVPDIENPGFPIAIRIMKAQGKQIRPSNLLFPIPQSEIDLNPMLNQNPGY